MLIGFGNKMRGYATFIMALLLIATSLAGGGFVHAQEPAAAGVGASVVSSTYNIDRFNPYQIRTLDPLPLYTAEKDAASSGMEISPQVLTVLAEGELITVDDFNNMKAPLYGQWLQVDTWLGPKWIFPLQTRYNELRDDDYELLRDGYIYDEAGNELGIVAPQTVHVREKTIGLYYAGSHRYLIDTWLGPQWINGRDIMKPAPETVKETIPLYLPGAGVLYLWPENNQRTFHVTMTPQQVVSDEHWRNWYHIKTADGAEGWIANGDGGWNNGQGVLFGEYQPVSTAVMLNAVKPLYQRPFAGATPVAELSPQTVTVKGQIGHWYLLDTWVGTVWMDDTDVTVLESGKK
ncbi:hypothetical protein [Paenibacillus sp. YN15]|uniref:hypothetical protein n=1 Tax=Paenibacillus sp. YN15 TaxID=1742774 RepID=UPI000DCE7C79|nr:hypothetical protein [Paenibacillus sp. YN15]RAU97625.1 hypothetical protein DQG13_18575 [Paenibacillus sp. YN15]